MKIKLSKNVSVFTWTFITSMTLIGFQNCTKQGISANDLNNSYSNDSYVEKFDVLGEPSETPPGILELAPAPEIIDPNDTRSRRQFLAIRFVKDVGFRVTNDINADIQLVRNRDGSIHASALHHDPECYFEKRNLIEYESELIRNSIYNLQYDVVTLSEDESITVDGPSSRIEIVWMNGKTQTLELEENGQLRQYQLARNGEEIKKIFNFMSTNFGVACQ